MILLRSADADSLIVRNKLAENVLPANRNFVEHYYYIQWLPVDTGPNSL